MLTLVKSDALYKQISNYFEKEIIESRLLPGDKIPSTLKLASTFKVNADTIQQSLKVLVKRGLVERVPGRGTFVRRGINSKTVGIIFGKKIYAKQDAMFFSVFLDKVTEKFSANGWNCKLYQTSELAKFDRALYELKRAVDSGEVRTVVEFCSNDMVRAWMKEECPVPYSLMDLTVDFYDLTINGLKYLLKQGCKNIVLVAHILKDIKRVYKSAVEQVQSEEGDAFDINISYCYPNIKDGYNAIKELSLQGKMPDGILFCNDSSFRGALYALLELGVSIPDEIKFVTHTNKGLDVFCHLPLTKMEVDPEDFAQEIYKRVSSAIKGEEYTQRPVRAKLAIGKTCGE